MNEKTTTLALAILHGQCISMNGNSLETLKDRNMGLVAAIDDIYINGIDPNEINIELCTTLDGDAFNVTFKTHSQNTYIFEMDDTHDTDTVTTLIDLLVAENIPLTATTVVALHRKSHLTETK